MIEIFLAGIGLGIAFYLALILWVRLFRYDSYLEWLHGRM